MKTRHAALALTLLSLLAVSPGAVAEEDPWALPSVEGALLVARLAESEKSYDIVLEDEPAADAAGPERVDLGLSSKERTALKNAEKLTAAGKHAKAEEIVDASVKKDPANWDALALRGACRLELGRKEEAEADLRDSIIGNRRNPAAWKALEKLAAATGRRVVRPTLSPRGWIRPPKDGTIELGYATPDRDGDFPWMLYAAGRAAYRHEGFFEKDFPKAKEYVPTFREIVFALASAFSALDPEVKPTEELARLLAERKAGTLLPFAFFALHTAPVTDPAERDFEKLRPRLVEYFDTHVLVKKEDG